MEVDVKYSTSDELLAPKVGLQVLVVKDGAVLIGRDGKKGEDIYGVPAGYWKGVLTNGFLYSMAFWALFSAYQSGGEVSRMFPMTLSTSVLVPIMGIVVLKEFDGLKRKLVATVILIFGIFLIGR